MATVLTTLMQRALRELNVGFVIPNADISAIAAGSFTAARWGQNSNLGGGDLQDLQAGFVRAGAASSADFWRPAGAVTRSSGVFAQAGSNWADTTVGSEEIECWYWSVRRDQEVLAALNRVLEFEYVTQMLALSHLSPYDGDMALSTDTNWTDVGTPTTSAKSTTVAVTPWGPRSYQLVADATNEGTRSTGIRVTQGHSISAFTIITADAGTASFQPYDSTNSAAYGTAITHSERRPQLMVFQNQAVPSTCKLTAVQMLGTVNPSTIYVNQAWLYNLDDLTVRLPSSVTEGYMVPRIIQAIPVTNTGTGTYDAGSFDFVRLTEGMDYWLVVNHADAEPYKVRFANPLPTTGGHPYQWPLFVEARVPTASIGTLSAETDSIAAPIHKVMPYFKKELLRTVYNTGTRRLADWQVQWNQAETDLLEAGKARPIVSIAPAAPYYAPRSSVY